VSPERKELIRDIAWVLIGQYPKHGPESHNYGTVGEVTTLLNKHLRLSLSSKTVGRILNHELKLPTTVKHSNYKYLITTLKAMKNLKRRCKIKEELAPSMYRMAYDFYLNEQKKDKKKRNPKITQEDAGGKKVGKTGYVSFFGKSGFEPTVSRVL
jgi:hypothetical protein